MTLREYLTSRTFVIQVVIALCIIFGIILIFMYWLDFTTNHGQEITVPNLSKLSEEQVDDKLDDLNLDYVILDSVDFRKDYPKFSVVEQDPLAGAKVKEGRKIYIKINSSGFTSVKIPDLIEKTYRQAEPTLKALGLEIGTIEYVPYLGKDMVLEMKMNGKKLRIGEKVLKNSKIDLVLGDGKVGFDDSQLDSLDVNTPQAPDGQ
ncbi:MAG TPA: PASTA domain-containing protein [Flavobacterium sp.]|nr:PASTA domain-containing protein [Flavobacterium sp.]